jgi:hypothetical protein
VRYSLIETFCSRGLRLNVEPFGGQVARGAATGYPFDMSTLQDIEKAVQDLSPEQLAAFRAWFVEYDQALWDKQLEGDVESGRLDSLANEALADLRDGRCTDL